MDWNNPGVEYLMKNFERIMVDYRDGIMSLTKSNNQMAAEKEQVMSRNKELEERRSHLEAKYYKLIEMYNKLLDGAGNGTTPDNPQRIPVQDPRRRPNSTKATGGAATTREFVRYPRPKPPARSEAGRPARDHVVHETVTIDDCVLQV